MNLHHGDCIEVMAGMEPESVDAIVTDPPYGLEFMGKEWDKFGSREGNPFDPKRVMKEAPAPVRGHPWASERPSHGARQKMPKCRTCGKWRYNGSPSSMCSCANPDWDYRISESIRPYQDWSREWAEAAYRVAKPSAYLLAFGGTRTVHRMTVALEDAGWIIRDMLVWAYASGFPKSKASLKPAWEPIVMARKPGPLRMLAIDACRIPTDDTIAMHHGTGRGVAMQGNADESWPEPYAGSITGVPTLGRWPANVILTDPVLGDEYSRFFLIPKADRGDREPVLGGQVPTRKPPGWSSGEQSPGTFQSQPTPARENVHPTVKPVDLMRHLVRLVTPTGGVVLDPFGGSGTTALAAEMEGFDWILVERELEYVRIAEARLNGTQRGLGLPA